MATATENISGISQPSPRQSSRHTQTIHSARPAAAGPRGEMGRQPHQKSLEIRCRDFLFPSRRPSTIRFATARRTKNRSKSRLISRYLRKKFPKPNPRVKFAPTPLNSRNLPLFSAISPFRTYLSFPLIASPPAAENPFPAARRNGGDCSPARKNKKAPAQTGAFRKI